MLFPDSAQFERAKVEGKRGEHTKHFMSTASFILHDLFTDMAVLIGDLKVICKQEWRNMVYAIIVGPFS